MKVQLTLLGTLLLVMSLNFNSARSADNSATLTPKEEALWEEVFGEGKAQPKQKQATNENSVNLTGVWVGYYEYDRPKGVPKGMFTAIAKDLGYGFSMTFLEPRDHSTEYVQAATTGLAPYPNGKAVSFKKVYNHSDTVIHYSLTIRHNGLVMDGTWRVNDNIYGRAFFYRLGLAELEALKKQSDS